MNQLEVKERLLLKQIRHYDVLLRKCGPKPQQKPQQPPPLQITKQDVQEFKQMLQRCLL